MARAGQSPLSIMVNSTIKQKFEDLYVESECNTKGDFLNQILDDFAAYDPDEMNRLKKAKLELDSANEELEFYRGYLQKFVSKGQITIAGKHYHARSYKEALNVVFTILSNQIS